MNPSQESSAPIEWFLVGVDFSNGARRALAEAERLAARSRAGTIVLHVIEAGALEEYSRLSEVPEAQLRERLEQARRSRLDAWLGESPPGATVREAVVRWGMPFEEILKAAREYAVDQIVLGVGGATTDLSHALFGGTAEKVLRGATCPVLCVPARGVSPSP